MCPPSRVGPGCITSFSPLHLRAKRGGKRKTFLLFHLDTACLMSPIFPSRSHSDWKKKDVHYSAPSISETPKASAGLRILAYDLPAVHRPGLCTLPSDCGSSQECTGGVYCRWRQVTGLPQSPWMWLTRAATFQLCALLDTHQIHDRRTSP